MNKQLCIDVVNKINYITLYSEIKYNKYLSIYIFKYIYIYIYRYIFIFILNIFNNIYKIFNFIDIY